MKTHSLSFIFPVAALGVLGAFIALPNHAAAQMMLAPKQASPVTPEDRAKMDKLVGTWQTPKVMPTGLKVEYPYAELEKFSTAHLQPWAKAKLDATEWDIDDTGAICKQDGIFRQGLATGGGITLVRSHDKLVQLGGDELGPRNIFMNSPHPADLLPTWDGDSRGHFEGNTLVVDTIGFNDKSWLGSDRIPHTEELHVIEMLSLHENDQVIEDRVFVDDRKALTAPYTFTRVWKLQPVKTMAAADAAPAGPGGREQVCNQTQIGKDPWRRHREALLKEHQEELDAFIQQTLDKK